jgi:hypothetical protein
VDIRSDLLVKAFLIDVNRRMIVPDSIFHNLETAAKDLIFRPRIQKMHKINFTADKWQQYVDQL